jgi:TonB-dependent receptor
MRSIQRLSGRAALLFSSAILVSATGALAQNTLTGRVTDENGAPLPGAQITIRETGQVIATDRQGRFVAPSLPAGDVTLDVRYLGFAPASQSATVTPSKPSVVDIVLNKAIDSGVIVITGTILDSTARALNQQRTADNQTNVVSSDAIGRFPDTNIAEALQRVPGFGVERDQGEGNFISIRGAPSEFTAITVDGVALPSTSPDTRAIDLGAIPSDVVAQIEVSKTLLPNQDADSIAGSVNLTTRSPFDNPRLRVNASGGISYNDLGGTNDWRASGAGSNVWGNVGALISASYSQTDRRVDNVESIWEPVTRPEGDEIITVIENELKDYDTRRERIGLTGALEYRPDSLNKLYLRGTFARRVDDEFRNLLVITYEDGVLQPGASEGRATWTRGRFSKEFRHRIVRDATFTFTGGGEHELPGLLAFDYAGSYTRAKQDYPFRSQLNYRSNVRPTLSYDYTADPNFPLLSLFQTQEHLNPANYDFRQNTFRSQDTIQEEFAFQTNFRIPGRMFGHEASFQFGARARLRDVTSDEERYRDRRAAAAPTTPLAGLLSNEESRNFDYFLGQKFDSDLVRAYFEDIRAFSQVPATRRIAQSVEADYEAKEEVYSAYAMTRVDFPNANLILGLRMEHTSFAGRAPRFNEVSETFTLESARANYTEWFPNATLRYEFSQDLIGRVALTRAIARPNYRDVVPRISENSDGQSAIVDVSRGNPDLRPTLSNNIDVGLEYYFRPLGLLSAAFFYKDLEDYEFEIIRPGEFAGLPARIREKGNARDGRIIGFEVAAQAQFTFLPGFLSGFGVFANYAYADAKITLPADVPNRTGSVRLPNQSRHTYNAALFYEVDRFNARIAFTGRSDYIDAFNEDPRFDRFWEGREQLDVTASFDLTRNINLFFEGKNLTDTAGVRYDGVRTRVYELEKFGPLFFFGGRVNF